MENALGLLFSKVILLIITFNYLFKFFPLSITRAYVAHSTAKIRIKFYNNCFVLYKKPGVGLYEFFLVFFSRKKILYLFFICLASNKSSFKYSRSSRGGRGGCRSLSLCSLNFLFRSSNSFVR